MALALRKSAMHAIPVLPMCFSNWRGILLNPELLFALKWCCRTVDNSSYVM
jgi:hypothetical protein